MANIPQNTYWPGSAVKSNEATQDSGVVGGDWAVGASTTTKTYNFDPTMLATAVADLLGFAVSTGAGGNIFRSLPMGHPECQYMYASRCSNLQGLGSNGQWVPPGAQQPSAKWRLYRFTVQFETPPYAILDNGVPEYSRFVIPDYEAESDFITRGQGSFVWGPNTPTPLAGRPIGSATSQTGIGLAQQIIKVKKSLLWVQVPDNGLFPGGFEQSIASPNIENCLGCVNQDQFLGHNPGTLLLTSWKPTARTMPAPSRLLNGNSISRSWDAALSLLYFNPPNMDGSYGDGGIRGHNLVPHPTNGNWYQALLPGSTAPNGFRYRYANFANMFKMNS